MKRSLLKVEGGQQGAEGVHPETFGVAVDLFCESTVYVQSKRDEHRLLLCLWMESLVCLAVAGIPYAINGLYTIPVEVFALTLSITAMLEISPMDPSADIPGLEFEGRSRAMRWRFLTIHLCFA